jgi:diguanylate cyclase (GGDEF)-like protein
MVLSMSPTYLRDAMAKVTLDSDDTLAVLGRSGEYLARNQSQEAALGKAFDPNRTFQPPAAADGVFKGSSPIDGVERFFQWQRLDDYPVTVLLGLSRAKVLGPTERVIAEINFKAVAGTVLLWTASGVVVWLLRRVRAQVRRRQEVEYLAMHDTLTGLNSRFALMKHLESSISAAAGGGSGRVGVLYMDLDGFKPVNDQYGHAVGDQVLQAVAGRLKNCVRGNDFPARIGGDEFVVVVGSLADDESLVQLGRRITEALARPLSLNGTSIRIGASIGLAVFPQDGSDADALLVHADKAMYAQKARVPRGA